MLTLTARFTRNSQRTQ